MTQIPHHIIKKSKHYYYDTVRDKWIHKSQLETYLKPVPDTDTKDKTIRSLRWDLNLD